MKTALSSGLAGRPILHSPQAGRDAITVTGSVVGKRVPNLHLVREKDRRRARDLSAVALVLAPLALVLLVFAWENVEVIRRGYELRRIGKERERLLEENRRLRSQLAHFSSLESAEKRARDMGFGSPRPSQVAHLFSPTAPKVTK